MSRRLFEILEDCENQGVRLSVNGSGSEALEVRGSSTPELRASLKANKPNLLHYLHTGLCHHDLKPEVCKVCNGYVRKLIEQGMSPEWAEAEVLGKDMT